MKRAFIVPAIYAPEVEQTLASMARHLHNDAELRDGTEPFPRGYVPDEMLDHTRTGFLVITIEERPERSARAVA